MPDKHHPTNPVGSVCNRTIGVNLRISQSYLGDFYPLVGRVEERNPTNSIRGFGVDLDMRRFCILEMFVFPSIRPNLRGHVITKLIPMVRFVTEP
ncbi:hypothetical protein C6497_10445 [Candidatus Poribacteria bacterium]|nr:MAG: hypothetical protein C6497_10445 [Candidatus Poribacteria bacterium]